MDTNHLTIRPKRPIGVSIISAIYLLAGGFTLAFYFISPTELTLDSMLLLLISIIIISASFGFSMGSMWGWWVITIICHVNIVSMIDLLLLSPGVVQDSDNYHVLEDVAILIFNLLILLYLFQKNVFEFYLFDLNTKASKLGISLALGILYYLGISFFR